MNGNFCEANGWENNRSKDELYSWWTRCVNNLSNKFIRLGIEYNGKLIGYGDLACIKENTTEIGIAIGESCLWGKEIGSNSTLCLMAHVLKELGNTVF
ncbi:hypothetical protein ACFQU5_11425 [Ureibacillus sp. GCM10028918]